MKKFIPFLIIICFWLIGCSDDDSSGNFIGTWIADSQVVSNCQDGNRNGPSDLDCDDVSCFRLALNGDKTFSFQRGLAIENGTWDVDGQLILCMDEEGEVSCEQFGVQFSGISMILTTDSTSSGCITTYFFNPDTSADTTQVN